MELAPVMEAERRREEDGMMRTRAGGAAYVLKVVGPGVTSNGLSRAAPNKRPYKSIIVVIPIPYLGQSHVQRTAC